MHEFDLVGKSIKHYRLGRDSDFLNCSGRSLSGLQSRKSLNQIRGSNRSSLCQDKLGSWLSDITGIDIDVVEAMENVLSALNEGLNHLANEICKLFEQIDWTHILANLEDLGHFIGSVMVEISPLNLVWQGLTTFPLTEHLARELDKFTGGSITSINDIGTLSGRALRGDAISEEELINDALFAAKVASVIVAGGSATRIIGAVADQMKKGTMGETELGRAVLSVATVAGIAYAQGGDTLTAAEHQAIREGAASGEKHVIANSPLGETAAGRALIHTVFAGTTSAATGGSFSEGATAAAKQQAAQQSAAEISKQTGLPVTPQLVESMANAGYPPDASKVDYNKLPSGVSWQSIVDAIARINLTPGIKPITIDLPVFTGGGGGSSSGVPVRSGDKGAAFITTNEVDLTQVHISPISIGGGKIVLPNPLTEQGMQEIINFWLRLKNMWRKNKKALYKKRITVGNQTVDVFYMEDGSFEYELVKSLLWLLMLVGGAFASTQLIE